jgi:hypothetical protein
MVRFLSALLAALGLVLLAPRPALAAAEDVFVVPRVPVQAQGESATAAKASAQSHGRRRAADILLRRLTIEEDWIYLPRFARGEAAAAPGDPALGKTAIALSDGGLEALESSFEVYSEKSSATTYRAYITYRFKPDAVRRLLKTARIPYSETQMRKALVLPVLQTDRAAYLWESNNPWMSAWRSRPLVNELTPMTLPLGDLEDAASVSASQALALDAARLQGLAERYRVSQIIVAHARLRQDGGQDQLTVRLINAFREIAAPAPELELDPTLIDYQANEAPVVSGEKDDLSAKVGDVLAQSTYSQTSGNFPALAESAIEAVIARYAGAWKSKTLIDHSHEAILETTAFFDSLADWSKIRAGLLATPLVGSVQVFALSPRGAELRLRVFGDPSRLAVAMENYGVAFWSEDGERWFLATPNRANQLRGSRALQRRRGLYSDDSFDREDPSAPRIEPSGQPLAPEAEQKIEQSH